MAGQSVAGNLKETEPAKEHAFTVVGADGSVTKKTGTRRKVGAGGRAALVEMFKRAVEDRTGQTGEEPAGEVPAAE